MKPIPTETSTDVGNVGKWLGAAAAGALLMYVLDPERGRARRARAVSVVRDAGARTGATVDHALHNAGERLVGLKDSAASALARGADRLQAEAAPLLERAQHSAHEAGKRLEHEADRARDRFSSSRELASAGHNTYEADRHYADRKQAERKQSERAYRDRELRENRAQSSKAHHERGGLSQMLQGMLDSLGGAHGSNSALLGGGMVGLLGLVRRKPAALLVGLAGVYLLTRGAGTQTYKVAPSVRSQAATDEGESAPFVPASTEQGKHYLH